MSELDIDNAIITLNTIYFFDCVSAQGLNEVFLEDMLIQNFKISREVAAQMIYSAAPYYYQVASEKTCLDYLIGYTEDRAGVMKR